MDPLFSATDLSAAPTADPELAVLANPDALNETGDTDTDPLAFAALLDDPEITGAIPEAEALASATLGLDELLTAVESGEKPALDGEMVPPPLPRTFLSGQAADGAPEAGNQSTELKRPIETALHPEFSQRASGPVTESQSKTAMEAPAPAPDIRRQADGQVVFQEEFPPGWEVLLEDTRPAKVPPPAQSSTEAEVLEPRTEDLPEFSLPDQSAKQKTKATDTSQAGLELAADRKPARVRSETGAPLRAPSQEQPAVRLDSEPALRAEMPTTSAGEVKSETLAVEWTSTATLATKATAPAPSQTLSQLTEVQKQMVIKDFAQATLKGLNSKQEQLSVELHPPDLGKVRVVVKSSGDNIHAQLTLQDQTVGEFFQERLEALRKSLEEAGIRLGNLSVEIKQNHQWETPGQEEQEADRSEEGNAVGRTPRAEAARTPVRSAAREGQSKVDLLL